jgi:predicted nucleotidyltransferase
MKRDDVLEVLRQHRSELSERFHVRSLGLFGSVARGEAGDTSDVDLLVDFSKPPGFDGYMNLKFWLEELLGARVDLVMHKALKPETRNAVEKEIIRVA